MAGTGVTERVAFRIGYGVTGRDGRLSFDEPVSEAAWFDLPVRDPVDVPEVMRVERRVSFADGQSLRATGHAVALGDLWPRQVIPIRSDGDVILRPVMMPGGLEPGTVDALRGAMTSLRAAGVDRARQPLHGASWFHYPVSGTGSADPWDSVDRADLNVTRVATDGRDEALAHAARSLRDACVIDGTVWVRAGLPLVTCHANPIHPGLRDRVTVPGYDCEVPDVPGHRLRSADLGMPLAVRNLGADEQGAGWGVRHVGRVSPPTLDAANLEGLARHVASRLRDWTFGTGDPEVRHAASTLETVLSRHARGAVDAAEAFARIEEAVTALERLAPDLEGAVALVGTCRLWARVAVPERVRGLDAARDATADEEVAGLVL